MKNILAATALTVGMAMVPNPAHAALIEGTLNLSGGIRVDTTGLLDFIPPLGGGFGFAQIDLVTNTGYFSVFNGGGLFGTNYRIAETDLLGPLYPPGPAGTFTELEVFEATPTSIQPLQNIVACAPDNGTTCVGGFLTNPSPLPGLYFSLESISPCAIGCGFGFQPQFSVTYTDGNTSVIMNVHGTVCDTNLTLADCNSYVGIFTAQFPSTSPTALIALLESQGYIETSFSASKISTPESAVPEPASLLLFGTGSAVAAAVARRRAKKAKKAADKA